MALMDAGRFSESEELFRQLIRRTPRNPDPYHGLGLLFTRMGRHGDAIAHLRRALQLVPGDPDLLVALSFPLHAMGESKEAASCYERVLARRPQFAEGWFNLGLIRRTLGQDAMASFEKAISLRPDYAEAHNSLGNTLKEAGRTQEALDHFQKAVALKPDLTEAWHNLGLALKSQENFQAARQAMETALRLSPRHPGILSSMGRLLLDFDQEQEAMARIEEALALDPQYPEALHAMGLAMNKTGRPDQAIAILENVIARHPSMTSVYLSLGNILLERGDYQSGLHCYRRLLERFPNHAPGHNDIANLFLAMQNPKEAEKHYRQAIACDPKMVDSYCNLASLIKMHQQEAEAMDLLHKAIAIKPDHIQTLATLHQFYQDICDFSQTSALLEQLLFLMQKTLAQSSGEKRSFQTFPEIFQLLSDTTPPQTLQDFRKLLTIIPPFSLISLPILAPALKQATKIWSRHQFGQIGTLTSKKEFPPPSPEGGKIRIGYLSGHYHEHATAYLITEVLEQHNRQEFEIILYSYGPADQGVMSSRLRQCAHLFRDMRHLSHAQMAEQIRQDQVEILVDLMGYTYLARYHTLAHKPAPIEMQWLGYPGTMAIPWVDYILADPWVIPHGAEMDYSEQVIRMPFTYQPNDRQRPAPNPPARSTLGLPENATVFTSPNQTYKISQELFADWMAILKQTPGSVLWLLTSNENTKANLRREAGHHGLSGDRLIFAPFVPLSQHIQRLGAADLYLDTFPCNGHTTASDALWAGVPVLTQPGETFASRVAASLVNAIGMPEMIAPDRDTYCRLAVELGVDHQKRAALREKLWKNRDTHPLFDSRRFTRHLEEVFRRIMHRYRQGLPPQGFDLPPD